MKENPKTFQPGGLLLALAIGLLYAAPHVWLKAEGYRLYYPSYRIHPDRPRSLDGHMNDHTYYTALSREVVDNGIPVREAYTFEGKTMPIRIHAVPETVMGLLIALLGSVDRMKVVASFLFPALTTWLFFRWILLLTRDRTVALTGAAIAMAGMYPALRILWTGGGAAVPLAGVGPYDRMPHPMLSVIPWVLFLMALFQLSNREDRPLLRAFGVGLLLGVQIFIYFFYWVHGVIVLGLWTAWRMWKREPMALQQGLVMLAVVLLVFLPYIAAMFSIPDDIRADFSERHSYTHGRFLWLSALIAPSAEAWVLHLLGFVGIVWLGLGWRIGHSPQATTGRPPPRRPTAAWFLGIMLLAALIAANQQLITGVILDPKHYYYRNFKPALAAGIAVTLVYGLSGLGRRFQLKRMWMLPLLVIFAFGFVVQVGYVQRYKRLYNLEPGVEQALDWLNSHTAVNSVVLAGQGHSGLIPVYTHNNVLLRHGKDFGTHEDGMKRLGLWASLFGMSEEQLRKMLQPNPHRQFHHDCIAWHYYPERRDEQQIEAWIDRVVEKAKAADVEQPGYRIDYLLWSKEEATFFGDNEQTERLRRYPVWSEDDCTIYELRPLFPRPGRTETE